MENKIYSYVMKHGKFFVTEMITKRKNGVGKEGVIQHGTSLCLSEKNDELAKQIFIKHKKERILELQKMIENYERDIKILEST